MDVVLGITLCGCGGHRRSNEALESFSHLSAEDLSIVISASVSEHDRQEEYQLYTDAGGYQNDLKKYAEETNEIWDSMLGCIQDQFQSITLEEIPESDLDESKLAYILFSKAHNLYIYLYSDNTMKTLDNGSRSFYKSGGIAAVINECSVSYNRYCSLIQEMKDRS